LGEVAVVERAAAKASERQAAQAAKWTCPNALEFWGQRLAADRLPTTWAEVLALFGLVREPEPAAKRHVGPATAAGGGRRGG
jgi:hypothetical protein